MIQKQSIVLALITSVGSPQQILSVEVDDGAKLLSEGLSLPAAKQSPLKETKDSGRLNVLLLKQSARKENGGNNNICLETLSFIS